MSVSKEQMNAGVLHAPHDLRYESVDVPDLGSEDVLVKISANGLCGSDIHFFEDGRLGPYLVTKPYIPGHEACGVVARAGKDARLAIGQRVAIEPGIPCRRCRFCKGGRYNLCEDVTFLSAPPVNGTFAEYAAVPWDFAHPLPDSVDDEAGAFVEPVSVGVQACNRGGLKAGASVTILGAGPIGLVTFLVARSFGAGEVYLIDLLKNRLDLAASLGAAGTVNPEETDGVEGIMKETDGRGTDVVFDTTGSSKAAALAPKIASRGGTVVHVGWPEAASFDYPIEEVIEKEIDIHGVNRYCNTYPTAISLMASGRLDVRPLVSHRFAFDKVVDAFAFAARHRTETMKVIVRNA